MALLLNRDEQVLLTDPGYPCNRHFVRVLEGAPVGVPVGPAENYQLSAESIARHWTGRTRAALIASPSNPTGTMVAYDEMSRIARAVDDLGGRLVVDEIYLGLSYEGAPRSALALSDDLFVVSSFSKYFNMTGWRLGWVVAPERHVRDLEKLAQNLYISPRDRVAARGARLLRAGDARVARGAPAGVSRAPRLPRARAARAGLRHSGDAGRRLLRLRRLLALLQRTASRSAATCWRRRAWPSRRVSTSARTGRTSTCASPTRWRWRSSRMAWPVSRAICRRCRDRRDGKCAACRDGGAGEPAVSRRLRLPGVPLAGRGRAGGADRGCATRRRRARDHRRSEAALRLARAQEIRAFASRELALPDNRSYLRYTDVGRPFVVWNVFAAPPLSLEPRAVVLPGGRLRQLSRLLRRGGRQRRSRAPRGAGRRRPHRRRAGVFDARLVRRSAALDVHPLSGHSRSRGSCSTSSRTRSCTSRTTRRSTSHSPPRSRRRASPAGSPRRRGRRAMRRWSPKRRGASDCATGSGSGCARPARSSTALYASDASDAEQRARKAAVFERMRAAYEAAKAGESGLAGYDRWFAGHDGRGRTTRASRPSRSTTTRCRRSGRCSRRKAATCRRSTAACASSPRSRRRSGMRSSASGGERDRGCRGADGDAGPDRRGVGSRVGAVGSRDASPGDSGA